MATNSSEESTTRDHKRRPTCNVTREKEGIDTKNPLNFAEKGSAAKATITKEFKEMTEYISFSISEIHLHDCYVMFSR